MERAAAINLMLLGGGLTMVGATMTLNAHNTRVACEKAHPNDPAKCVDHSNGGGGGGGHGGYFGGSGSASSSGVAEGSIARGGFGGFGEGGGGHGSGGE